MDDVPSKSTAGVLHAVEDRPQQPLLKVNVSADGLPIGLSDAAGLKFFGDLGQIGKDYPPGRAVHSALGYLQLFDQHLDAQAVAPRRWAEAVAVNTDCDGIRGLGGDNRISGGRSRRKGNQDGAAEVAQRGTPCLTSVSVIGFPDFENGRRALGKRRDLPKTKVLAIDPEAHAPKHRGRGIESPGVGVGGERCWVVQDGGRRRSGTATTP